METPGFTKDDTNIAKGIAALMLMFHHLFNEYGEYWGYEVDYIPLTGDQTIAIGLFCKLCVAVFVFLTGYGMAASFAKSFPSERVTPPAHELAAFAVSRWWNLMTRYWFIYVLALVCAPLGRTPADAYGPGIRATLAYGCMDFLGIAEAVQTPRLNPTWWYMSLAILLIFITPLVMLAARRIGSFVLLVGAPLLLSCFHIESSTSVYLASYLLGVFCFDKNVFARWKNVWLGRGWGSLAKALVLLGLFCFLGKFREEFNFNGVVDAILAMILCAGVCTVVNRIPGIREALRMLGRHSGNIFFTHTLLYSYYFLGFYYSFRFPLVILAVLTITTLLLSVVLEKLKEALGYNRFMQRCGNSLLAWLS